jgi:hypothetical protein
MYRSFYKRWNNPTHVAKNYQDFTLDNLERYYTYLKNFKRTFFIQASAGYGADASIQLLPADRRSRYG